MKKIERPEIPSLNLLHAIHSVFVDFPVLLRDRIKEECDYSTPTYYRKMRSIKPLSNAERDKIGQVTLECISSLHDICKKLIDSQKDS